MVLMHASRSTVRRIAGTVRLGESRPHGRRGIGVLPPITPWPTSQLRIVKVSKDGGASGGAATTCSWTYTVTTLKDVEMETGITPEHARHSNIEYAEAGAGGRSEYAFAQYVEGTLILMNVEGEIPLLNTC